MSWSGKAVRVFAYVTGVLLALPVLGVVGFLSHQAMRDPLDALTRKSPVMAEHITSDRIVYPSGVARRVIRLTLVTEEAGEIPVLVSLPTGSIGTETRYPSLVLASGLRKGRENVLHAPAVGENAVIGFDYPLPKRVRLADAVQPSQLVALIRGVHRTPAHMAAVFDWVGAQEWVDPERRLMVAASLGGLAFPAAWRMVQDGSPPAAGAVGYTGAGLQSLFGSLLTPGVGGPMLNEAVSWLMATAIAPLEPARHLPYLRGEFLFLFGDTDGKIPEESVALYARLLPEPKSVEALAGGHIGEERAATDRAMSYAGEWFAARGLVNPW